MPKIQSKGMVNREAVGTYQGKLHQRSSGAYSKAKGGNEEPVAPVNGIIDNIQCDGDVVPIDSLTPDPNNARLHPERNLEAIKASLVLYGQRKPLVVRKQGWVVVAGNGTLEAARQLGWSVLAASIRPMTDAEAVGYGLADNRTAELARWDFEVVARLERLAGEGRMVGWSADEIAALRNGEKEPAGVVPKTWDDLTCPECGHVFPRSKK